MTKTQIKKIKMSEKHREENEEVIAKTIAELGIVADAMLQKFSGQIVTKALVDEIVITVNHRVTSVMFKMLLKRVAELDKKSIDLEKQSNERELALAKLQIKFDEISGTDDKRLLN